MTARELEEVRAAIDWLDTTTPIYEGSDADSWEVHQRWAEENGEADIAARAAQIAHLLRTVAAARRPE